MKNLTLDDLNVHLFETIEMLKNNSDEKASANEKIDIDTAKQIASIGKVIIEGYKTKIQAISLLNPNENPEVSKQLILDSGLSNEEIKG